MACQGEFNKEIMRLVMTMSSRVRERPSKEDSLSNSKNQLGYNAHYDIKDEPAVVPQKGSNSKFSSRA